MRQHDGERSPGQRLPGQPGSPVKMETAIVQGQVAVVRRVGGQNRQPLGIHMRLLAAEACELAFECGNVDGFLADTAFMEQARMRRPDVQIPLGADLEAEVHVIVGNRQVLLVETADLVIDRLADHQTGRRDHAVILVHQQTLHVAGRVASQTDERMRRRPFQAHDDAGVLDIAAGVEQFRADDSNFRPQRVIEQRLQPVILQHRCVVVQQDQVFAVGMSGRQVVDRREVESIG
nr:hypothetical protein [Tanacetum cinerariifolium]